MLVQLKKRGENRHGAGVSSLNAKRIAQGLLDMKYRFYKGYVAYQ